MPLIGVLTGGLDFTTLAITVGAAEIKYGQFLQNIFDFIIIALCIFLMIKGMNSLKRKKVEEPAPEPEPTEPSNEEKLLTEIRDLLKKQ